MIEIGLIGGGFTHAHSSTDWKKPTKLTFCSNQLKDVTCFVDEAIVPNIGLKGIKKIGWVLESSAIQPHTVNDIIRYSKEISDSYEFIISHDKRIVDLAPNFYYLPPHGYWVGQYGQPEPQIYPKTKLCSMVTSNKRMCPGHDFRLGWMKKLQDHVDLYGRGFNDFKYKEDALADYLFSVTIENDSYETYWTEKILDCFVCGTIPIYHGAPDIGDYFNMDGVILLTDDFDIKSLTPELYLSKEDAIIDNFKRALQYNVIEDLMWDKYIYKLYE